MIAITKSTLKELNRHRGTLDTSTGMVFTGFIGRLFIADGLYHGEIKYAVPACDGPLEASFDINEIINRKGIANGDPHNHADD